MLMKSLDAVQRLGSLGVASCLTLGLLISAAPAIGGEYLTTSQSSIEQPTDTSAYSERELDTIREFLEENKVSTVDQDLLIAKLRNGETWDSLIPGRIPREITTKRRDSKVYSISRFADGSLIVSTIDDLEARAQNEFIPFGVYGCSFSGSTYAGYWRDCKADANYGLLRLGFSFNYENVRGVGSRITSYHTPFFFGVGASMSNPSFHKSSANAVRLTAQITIPGLTVTRWVQANTSSNSAWSSNG